MFRGLGFWGLGGCGSVARPEGLAGCSWDFLLHPTWRFMGSYNKGSLKGPFKGMCRDSMRV